MKMNLTMRITILCFVFLIAGIPVSDGVKEVKIDPKEGSCRATSSWSFQHNPNKACSPSQSNYWHNAKSSTLPQTLFFQSKEKVRVTRFKLEGGKDKRYYPRQFTFFGSNDEDCLREDKWEYQREFQAVSYSGVKKNLFEATTNDNNQEFRCYGIKIEKSNYHYSYAPYGWYAAVHLLEFFTSEQHWRPDGHCGPRFPINGRSGECDPSGKHPCCSNYGWCGNTENHCRCSGCIDYRIQKGSQMQD